MEETSFPPLIDHVAVISQQFCAANPVDLVIFRKLLTWKEGTFIVTDGNGNVMFKVRGKVFSLRGRRVLLDASGNPIVSSQRKIISPHKKWKAFRGESFDNKDLLFSVRKSKVLQLKTKLNVFLASNKNEDNPDFKIEGSWFERSCTIYPGDSSIVLTQMHRIYNVQSVLLGKDTFAVTVYPNVDQAFIVALIAILEEINEDRNGRD